MHEYTNKKGECGCCQKPFHEDELTECKHCGVFLCLKCDEQKYCSICGEDKTENE